MYSFTELVIISICLQYQQSKSYGKYTTLDTHVYNKRLKMAPLTYWNQDVVYLQRIEYHILFLYQNS